MYKYIHIYIYIYTHSHLGPYAHSKKRLVPCTGKRKDFGHLTSLDPGALIDPLSRADFLDMFPKSWGCSEIIHWDFP